MVALWGEGGSYERGTPVHVFLNNKRSLSSFLIFQEISKRFLESFIIFQEISKRSLERFLIG